MIKAKIEKLLKSVVGKRLADIEVFAPDNEKFGHYSTNIALKLAPLKKKSPLLIAEEILGLINKTKPDNFFEKIEIAPPGFINFWLSPKALQNELRDILKNKGNYGKPKLHKTQIKKIQIEFISANPTGPLTLGNGRGGFLGDALANILQFYGHHIHREYYVNDAKTSTQIKELGKTVIGEGKSYLTPYLRLKIKNQKSKIKKIIERFKNDKEKIYAEAGHILAKAIQKDNQKTAEKILKIKFDSWFSEQSIYEGQAMYKFLGEWLGKNLIYMKDDALWFKAKDFGDTEDRVLIRQTGEPTYFLSDLAYHYDKFKIRRFDKVIDIWGADHHGYIPRLKAGLKATGINPQNLQVIISQIVHLMKNNKPIRMSKRKGEYLTIEDLIKEVGLDASRFFSLMNLPESHVNFDLKLAKEQSLKNPVYYVQYAAVRSQSILKKAKFKRLKPDLKLLNTKEDLGLIRLLVRFPEVIEDSALNYNPQILVRYSLGLAGQFHNFYEKERVVVNDRKMTDARLSLIQATATIFKNSLSLLGISVPKKM